MIVKPLAVKFDAVVTMAAAVCEIAAVIVPKLLPALFSVILPFTPDPVETTFAVPEIVAAPVIEIGPVEFAVRLVAEMLPFKVVLSPPVITRELSGVKLPILPLIVVHPVLPG